LLFLEPLFVREYYLSDYLGTTVTATIVSITTTNIAFFIRLLFSIYAIPP